MLGERMGTPHARAMAESECSGSQAKARSERMDGTEGKLLSARALQATGVGADLAVNYEPSGRKLSPLRGGEAVCRVQRLNL